MRFNNNKKWFLIIGILLFLTYSCEQKKSEFVFKSYSDAIEKFQIDIPENWDIEKFSNEYSSTILFADSTKKMENALVYDVVWDSIKISLNDNFKRTMDSIVISKRQEILNQSFDSLNGFKVYRFDTVEFDSLNNQKLITTHNYIENHKKLGHIIFNYTRTHKDLTKSDSIITQKIMRTIKWK